jgi:hypothetical protein
LIFAYANCAVLFQRAALTLDDDFPRTRLTVADFQHPAVKVLRFTERGMTLMSSPIRV